MKCEFCGASITLPDPPQVPSYSETYKELREEMGQLEYENSVLVEEKATLSELHIKCQKDLMLFQTDSAKLKKGKSLWKGASFFLIAANILWICMLGSLAGGM